MLVLPPSSALRVSAAIDTWCQWTPSLSNRPEVVRFIKGGLTNVCFLLQCDDQFFVLRLNNPRSKSLGINRDSEKTLLEALKKTRIVPDIVYWCPQHTFTVFSYIHGRVWHEKDFASSRQVNKLDATMGLVKTVEPDIKPFDYLQHVDNYWSLFTKRHPSEARKLQRRWFTFKRQLSLYNRIQTSRVTTHHDLVPSNIIEQDGNIFLIDWEYAGLGYRNYDNIFIRQQRRSATKHKKYIDTRSDEIQVDMMRWLSMIWFKIR